MNGSEQPESSTITLLDRAREGDQEALDELFARYAPVLARWARGRLPRWARDLTDTSDLVQDTLIAVFKRLDTFEHRREGAFHAYLRQAVMNRIRNELRNAKRRPQRLALDSKHEDEARSPLEQAIGAESVDRYEAALQVLDANDRELLIARVELGLSYAEIADAAGKSSPDAARMAVARAIVRLTDAMSNP